MLRKRTWVGPASLLLVVAGCSDRRPDDHEVERLKQSANRGDIHALKRVRWIQGLGDAEREHFNALYEPIEARHLREIGDLMRSGEEYREARQWALALTRYDGALGLALGVRAGETTEVYLAALNVARCLAELGETEQSVFYARLAAETEQAIRPTNPEISTKAADLLTKLESSLPQPR